MTIVISISLAEGLSLSSVFLDEYCHIITLEGVKGDLATVPCGDGEAEARSPRGLACCPAAGSWWSWETPTLLTSHCENSPLWYATSEGAWWEGFSFQIWTRLSRTPWTLPHCVHTYMCQAAQALEFPKDPSPKDAREGKGSFSPRGLFTLQLMKDESKPYRLFHFSPWGLRI